MLKDVYDPLTEYAEVFNDRFKEVAEKTFDQLAAEANVDQEANRKTCKQVYDLAAAIETLKGAITNWTWICAFLWIVVVAGIAVLILYWNQLTSDVTILIVGGAAMILLFLFTKVHSTLKTKKAERDTLDGQKAELEKEAWKQMEPLNRLYDWDVLTRMMTATVPRLEFDPYFTTQRLADLQQTYGWDGSFNTDRSVLYSHSGLINGNPFVICRTKRMEMGTKTYYGSKTIYWTTIERDANGKSYTRQHSQTLHASVDAPYPEYPEETCVIYGNTAAPDLIFHRQQSGLAKKVGSLKFKMKRNELRRKARDLEGDDFAMMTNEDFEVAFNTSDRNNNQQFALLFTPVAQESMMKLLQDSKYGYGDDFDFDKEKMINTITPDHLQSLNLDLNPAQYRGFDFDKAKRDFYNLNVHYFRAIYFSMAPLLCVPIYQQIRPLSDIYGRDMQQRSSFWEHEALANFWGNDHFKHPDCVTDCVLKTEEQRTADDNVTINVSAYGYRSEERVTYVTKLGGDGRFHDVPVYWDEYLPVTGKGSFQMREDNTADNFTTQDQRLGHIHQVLNETNLDMYRRHIASRV